MTDDLGDHLAEAVDAAAAPVAVEDAVARGRHLRRRHRAKLTAAIAGIACIAVAAFVVARPTYQQKVRVADPATATASTTTSGVDESTTSRPIASGSLPCPVSGTAANGKTYGAAQPTRSEPPPDFVIVTRHGTRIGYADRKELGRFGRALVYGCDLTTVRGLEQEGLGFIPIGVKANAAPTPNFIGHWHVHGSQLEITSNIAGVLISNCGAVGCASETDALHLARSPDGTEMTATITSVTFSDNNGRSVPNPGDSLAVGDSFSLRFVAPQLMKQTPIHTSIQWGNPYWCGQGLAPMFASYLCN